LIRRFYGMPLSSAGVQEGLDHLFAVLDELTQLSALPVSGFHDVA
jgi:hypothetical protein